MIRRLKKRGKKEWNVYILRCGDDTLYTGIAKNVEARFLQHQSGKGAAYTRTHLPVALIYQENGMTRSSALVREAAIKRLPRPQKEKLLQAVCRVIAIGLIFMSTSMLQADLRDRIIDHMDKAGSSIDLVVYEIRSNEIVDALISAKHRGVRVRILVDSVHSPVATPQEKTLEEEGIAVKRVRGISHDLMHEKFILFDGSVASTPSYNRSAKSLRAKDEEEAAFTHDKAQIEKLKTQFENFWNHTGQDEIPETPEN